MHLNKKKCLYQGHCDIAIYGRIVDIKEKINFVREVTETY
jgi:hypothetical protein